MDDITSLAWGAQVSSEFRARVIDIAAGLGTQPDYLMACMAFESGRTFCAAVRNAAGSGAVGLIQFMEPTARSLGTSTKALARMSAVEQLGYVERYLTPFRGRLSSLSDVYMAILWPAAVGKPESSVLWTQGGRPTTYRQNAGLDVNHDGAITKAEAAARVHDMLVEGCKPDNVWRKS